MAHADAPTTEQIMRLDEMLMPRRTISDDATHDALEE